MRTVLTDAPWLCAVAQVFSKAGVSLYLRGNSVRGSLLGFPIKSVHFCGQASAQAVCILCEGTAIRASLRKTEPEYVELCYLDEQGCHRAEYTALFGSGKSSGCNSNPQPLFSPVEEDAHCRAFTVNALYRPVFPDGLGEILDPVGGLLHLKSHILQTVSDNPDEVFQNDGLNVLRAARYQAELDLKPTSALKAAFKRNAGLLSGIQPERLRDEFQKILLADLNYDTLPRTESGTWQGLEAIAACGAWKILFPGISYPTAAAFAMGHAPTPSGIFAVSGNPLTARLALLFQHADVHAVQDALKKLRFSQEDIQKTCLCINILKKIPGGLSPIEGARAGEETLLVCGAICEALGEEEGCAQIALLLSALRGKPLSPNQLAVGEQDIRNLLTERGQPEGQAEAILNQLWQQVLEGSLPNNRDALLNKTRLLLHSCRF